MLEKFNVRVYGLLVKDENILISRETYGKYDLIKFPGGGVELGEGVIDTLHREFFEELNVEIFKYKLFYITEDFIQSAFKETEQVIGIYYLVEVDTVNFEHTEHKVSWVKLSLDELDTIGFTFEQDQYVFRLICNHFNKASTAK